MFESKFINSVTAIGLELGTTHSQAALIRNGTFDFIPNSQAHTSIPSCVAFTDEGVLVGFEALEQASTNPRNTICDVR